MLYFHDFTHHIVINMKGKTMKMGEVYGNKMKNVGNRISMPIADEITEKLILQPITFYESLVKFTTRSARRTI